MLRRSIPAAGEALIKQTRDARHLSSMSAKPKLRTQVLNVTEELQARVVGQRKKLSQPERDQLDRGNLHAVGLRCDFGGQIQFCICCMLNIPYIHGFIPLNADHWSVKEETHREQQAGMPVCDCSNCEPAQAEAVWVAQQAFTAQNFNDAMAMDSDDLLDLIKSLPQPPPEATCNTRPVAMYCGVDDPILESTTLEALVTHLEVAFHKFYFDLFDGQSNLGPTDYFGRDLAWDMAKNVDVFQKPSNLSVVLASEVIHGQFECLFGAITKWKSNFNTVSTFAAAKQRRLAQSRTCGPQKPPLSVEGALLAKQAADAAKKAQKDARDLAALAKLEARSQLEQAKKQVTARNKGLPVDVRYSSSNSQPVQARVEPVGPKRRAYSYSSAWPSGFSHEDSTFDAPHRYLEDRPAAESALFNLIMLRKPIRHTFTTCAGGRPVVGLAKWSSAYLRNACMDVSVME
ncbi:uncharacterized protein MELLADRAFT_102090 [Melampsora larici-populina 98AG31]|uniref:Uncharacterized protein n=1 Tax=Melampsora larici-populina (strain 98AG31 / pathotype 3-4-7) TaxID=747676 RepID=F4R5Z0_MELLP|nr:uncharacterized protein MELLADRAFT_102090 [Melampsora larici-populina 98AG31]EGG12123.1 hypothetical protein MELLADRAFT_102090 [Melampsora larici-populina 98AG31]